MQSSMEKSMSKRLQINGKGVRVFTVDAQQAVWALAPRDWIGKRKAAIAGVARDLGWKFSRTWNIAHGRAKRIDAEEWVTLKARLNELQEGAVKRRETLDGLNLRLTELRAANPESDSRGTAPTGGRSDGEIPGGAGEGGGNPAVRPAR